MNIESAETISPYIGNIKDWKIREIISGYFDAHILFQKNYKKNSKQNKITFSTLRKICDILYDTKENFHLIFKRVLNPKKKIFENADKITPNELEIMFMNNIGIIFHRVLVARELKYLLDSYDVDSEGYEEVKKSLEVNLSKINYLFGLGVDIIIQVLENYQDNILLLTYFLENMASLKDVFKDKFEDVITIFTSDKKLEDIYFATGKYYLESGWEDRAKSIFKQVLKQIPNHKEAIRILKKIK